MALLLVTFYLILAKWARHGTGQRKSVLPGLPPPSRGLVSPAGRAAAQVEPARARREDDAGHTDKDRPERDARQVRRAAGGGQRPWPYCLAQNRRCDHRARRYGRWRQCWGRTRGSGWGWCW